MTDKLIEEIAERWKPVYAETTDAARRTLVGALTEYAQRAAAPEAKPSGMQMMHTLIAGTRQEANEPVAWMVTAARNGEVKRSAWITKSDADVMVDALKNNRRNSFITPLYAHTVPVDMVCVPRRELEDWAACISQGDMSVVLDIKAMLLAAKGE